MARLIALVLIGLGLLGTTVAAQSFGRFDGDFVFRWLDDGRNMKLVGPLKYVDPTGKEWTVPAGAETDGASIPRVLWPLAGPFEGKHRNAAVVHDHYCQTRSQPWRATHLVFYNAMRATGVSETTAKTMYGAVYYFGPRWGIGAASKGPGASQNLSPEQEKMFVNDLQSWIEANQPDINSLTNELDNPQFPRNR